MENNNFRIKGYFIKMNKLFFVLLCCMNVCISNEGDRPVEVLQNLPTAKAYYQILTGAFAKNNITFLLVESHIKGVERELPDGLTKKVFVEYLVQSPEYRQFLQSHAPQKDRIVNYLNEIMTV